MHKVWNTEIKKLVIQDVAKLPTNIRKRERDNHISRVAKYRLMKTDSRPIGKRHRGKPPKR